MIDADMPRRTRLPVLLASVLVASSALAAPDEEVLGKAEGYPICRDQPLRPETRCLVGLVSRWDDIH